MPGSSLPHCVRVVTTARLHMGFLDMHGGLGRRFGSIGLSLDQPATRLAATRAADFKAEGVGAQRALACARHFAERAGLAGGVCLELDEVIPEHAGLGSGTQMALAVGVALSRLYGLPHSVRAVAALTGRGRRSGIGIGAFEQGGLLLDGGRGVATVVPPVISRLDFPESWQVLLIFDRAGTGVHGGQEAEAFRTLPEFPAELAADLCRRTLMQALPAVVEQDLLSFGRAIHEIQCRVGDFFAAAQGGGRYTSAAVGQALEWLRVQGVECVGQSSWGPTGFAVIGSEMEAQKIVNRLKTEWGELNALEFSLCKARNQGSEVHVIYEKNLAALPAR